MKTKPRRRGPETTGNSSTRALVPVQHLEVPQQPRKNITDHSSGRLSPLFVSLLRQQAIFVAPPLAVMSGHPIIASNRGLLARPNPSACLTTTICPAWLVRLAFRLSIRAALEAAPQQKHNRSRICYSRDRASSATPMRSEDDVAGKSFSNVRRVRADGAAFND